MARFIEFQIAKLTKKKKKKKKMIFIKRDAGDVIFIFTGRLVRCLTNRISLKEKQGLKYGTSHSY